MSDKQYTRLDDDVSFQILRTNPKLTTNTKIMYDGSNIFLDSYDADPILVTKAYRGKRAFRSGLYNNDIKDFLKGCDKAAYKVGRNMDDTIIGNSFDYQFENMYWCGVESVVSYTYPQELGCVAPLYIRKKLPEYFVIFKIDNPSNMNMTQEALDTKYDFREDILKRAHIVKTFSLKEGTALGDYIRNYTQQNGFEYDKSIYVNFSSNEIHYYGIDRNSGVLTRKVENMNDDMMNCDRPILRTDEYITEGFERNDLIFPYIMNIEFLFDDNCEEYTISRYFGMYCNAIDLHEFESIGGNYSDGSTTIFTHVMEEGSNKTQKFMSKINENSFYYIKDKYDNLYSIDKDMKIKGEVDASVFTGYEPVTVSIPIEKMKGLGCSTAVLRVTEKPVNIIINISNTKYESNPNIDAGAFNRSRQFSIKDTEDEPVRAEDVAKAIAGVIKKYPPEDMSWLTAHAYNDLVFIETTYPGSGMDGRANIGLTSSTKGAEMLTSNFYGGTDVDGCLFRIDAEYKDMFFDEDGKIREDRYMKCSKNICDSAIRTVMPYVNNFEVDENYYMVVSDIFGPYVKISNSGYTELMDKYFAKIGVLSFFPVRDFDFDTMKSPYGESTMMKNEIAKFEEETGIKMPPYCRFYTENGKELATEYDYYLENLIPELSITSKTVPYITKWCYTDESKDSCENPYRLNASKIFDTCNFSANTFITSGDIMEYTHSMPYYTNGKTNNNEYGYVSGLSKSLSAIKRYFEDTETDNFDKSFSRNSTSKRFDKKYSRFLNGSDVNYPSTLFRGVKFEIVELYNGKEVKTSRYNDYRFSFLYVSTSDSDVLNTVHFIKNDTFKFIVGVIFIKQELSSNISKANAYAGGMGLINKNTNNN